jgi:DNA-binding NtrC family response regulator
MSNTSVLVLDFDSTGSLGLALQRILGSVSTSALAIRQEYIQTSLVGLRESDFSALCNHDVVCPVLPAGSLKEMVGVLQFIKAQSPRTPLMVITDPSEPDELLKLLQAGAADFITPPLRTFDILPRIIRLIDHTRRSETACHSIKEQLGLKQLVGRSEAFLAEIRKIPIIAQCDASVLISGETGTGKELCARAIHYLGPRNSGPFLPINCGAIPPELMENELFGHERGAFTDASNSRQGLIHDAEGGTLLLDEVDALLPQAQVKLLRFLQDKEYRALGSNRVRKADVRVIAATNVNVETAVASGKLRADFYYRLSTVPLVLPPLRERRDDIPLLINALVSRYAAQYSKKIEDLAPDALRALLVYRWPGNVRELEHVIERAVVMSEGHIIKECDVSLPRSENRERRQGFKEAKAQIVAQFEKSYIQGMLIAFQGNITKAARAANKNRRAFWQLIRKHDIDVERFKRSGS